MSKILRKTRKSEGLGVARIETGLKGCFSADRLTVELEFDETDKAAVKIRRGEKISEITVQRVAAELFLSQIIAAADKPEVLSDSHRTTYYFAHAEWRDLNFMGGRSSGEIRTSSNEWTTEQIEKTVPEIKDAAFRDKVRMLLAKGLHRRAIEIYLQTENFANGYLSEDK